MVGALGTSSTHPPSPVYCFSAEIIPTWISSFCRTGAGKEHRWAPAPTHTKRAKVSNVPQLKRISRLKLANTGLIVEGKAQLQHRWAGRCSRSCPCRAPRAANSHRCICYSRCAPGIWGAGLLLQPPFLTHSNCSYPAADVLPSSELLTISVDPSGCHQNSVSGRPRQQAPSSLPRSRSREDPQCGTQRAAALRRQTHCHPQNTPSLGNQINTS